MRETLVKSEEFKDSPLGKIPKDWETPTFEEVTVESAPICYGIVQPGSYVESGVPVVAIQNLNSDYQTNIHRSAQAIESRYIRSRIHHNDVLLSVKGTIGRVDIVPSWFSGNISRDVARIRLKPCTSPRYIRQMLLAPSSQKRLEQAVVGTTRAEISIGILKQLRLPLPPLPEQERIAEILDTMDEAIAHTSSLIAKLKQMKAGLLHDLLTRGLDENGELRDAIAHPEQFKHSPLGQVPKEWDVLEVNHVSEDITYGLTIRPQYFPQGIPLVSAKECFDGWIDYENANKISEVDYRALRLRSIPNPGDVLFTKTGTVGRIARIKFGDPRCALSQNVALIKPRHDKVTSEFLELSLKSENIRRQTAIGITTLSIPDLQLAVIGRFLLPIPPKAEQSEIVISINSHDTRIRTEEAYRDKLKLQKQGLMHDLLTGKVRVKNA